MALVRIALTDDHNRVDTVCELPDLIFGNGMIHAAGRLLVADSLHGHVVIVDPDRHTSSVWLARLEGGLWV